MVKFLRKLGMLRNFGTDWWHESLHFCRLGLDFYHLSENVHRCRREVFGEKDESGQKWAREAVQAGFEFAGGGRGRVVQSS